MVFEEKAMNIIGIDIGGTSIKGAGISHDGKVMDTFSLPIDASKSGEEIINNLALLTKEYISQHSDVKFEGVGLGVPGIVNNQTGVVIYSNNLRWSNLPITKIFHKHIDLPIRLTNDANAAALAEIMFGNAKDYHSCILLTLGTGVGSGIILNRKLYEGNEGKGAEIGHMVIVQNGRQCTCGRKGCFEAYASATGLIKTTKEIMIKYPQSKIWELVDYKLENVNGGTAFKAYTMNDEAGYEIVKSYITSLGEGILNLCNIFRPEVILLSGGIANEGEVLFDLVNLYLKEHQFGYPRTPEVKVLPPKGGYDIGKIGAACLFFQ